MLRKKKSPPNPELYSEEDKIKGILYNHLIDITKHVLEDWNIDIKKTESHEVFSVLFNSLKNNISPPHTEKIIVFPYQSMIQIYNENHIWPAEILRSSYSISTGNEYYVDKVGR